VDKRGQNGQEEDKEAYKEAKSNPIQSSFAFALHRSLASM
jgi:hypothetical protein